jgi:hypothetical protein
LGSRSRKRLRSGCRGGGSNGDAYVKE